MAAREPILFIISSPSGAGKTTLCRRLLAETTGLRFSVSHTTRTPRANEENGKDYHFIPRDEFESRKGRGTFLEWAEVHGNLYGTSIAELDKAREAGCDLLCDIDFQGADQIRKTYPASVAIFILPPSIEELHRRLELRATDTPEAQKVRFHNARYELLHYKTFDFLVINDRLEEALAKLKAIVEAERCRASRMSAYAERLVREFKGSGDE